MIILLGHWVPPCFMLFVGDNERWIMGGKSQPRECAGEQIKHTWLKMNLFA